MSNTNPYWSIPTSRSIQSVSKGSRDERGNIHWYKWGSMWYWSALIGIEKWSALRSISGKSPELIGVVHWSGECWVMKTPECWRELLHRVLLISILDQKSWLWCQTQQTIDSPLTAHNAKITKGPEFYPTRVQKLPRGKWICLDQFIKNSKTMFLTWWPWPSNLASFTIPVYWVYNFYFYSFLFFMPSRQFQWNRIEHL